MSRPARPAPHAEDDARLVEVLGLRNPIVVGGPRNARVAAVAACQRGRVAHRQLRAAGLTPGQVTRMVAGRRLFVIAPHVYAVGHAGPTPLGRETAALLATRTGALLSHRDAGRLWGFAGVSAPDEGEAVHVLTGPSWSRPRTGVTVHRSQEIGPADRRVKLGLPVISPARALLELVGELGPRGTERAYEQLLLDGLLAPRDLLELGARVRRHPGRAALLALAEDHLEPAMTRSSAEERLLVLVRDAGLPAPRVNTRVCGYEVDFLWPKQRCAVEVDGYRYHSSRAALERDHDKDARLRDDGWEIRRVAARRLRREPYAVVAEIARMLARRAV